MKTGVIAGSFDLLHPGYIDMFIEAKRHCDRLIVLLHTDPTIERPDKSKPVFSIDERRKTLLSVRFIDGVRTYTLEQQLAELLVEIDPDIRFLGSDYRNQTVFTGSDLGIPVRFLSRQHGWSTTKLRKLIASTVIQSVS